MDDHEDVGTAALLFHEDFTVGQRDRRRVPRQRTQQTMHPARLVLVFHAVILAPQGGVRGIRQ